MKLSVAIAVLMLVLAAHSDAQEAEVAEPTIEQRFADFQQQMQTLTDDLGEKTKAALEKFHTSDIAVKTKSFFAEQFEKIKAKIDETFPKES
ncbi:apolipoprotein C-I [Clupea harengus]|uniref:Apolipoprotein C-I n=1 Tax=Clupea harengus TaxID=7950 RepID=A0A6P3VQS0_CLUHA|nr:apolipoprotein C-I [Clupea harengus]